MIFIDNEINEILNNAAGITALVDDRIFRGVIPENTPNPVLQFGSSVSPMARFKGGRSDKADLMIKVYANSDNECLTIISEIDEVLEGLQGVNDETGFKIKNIQLVRIFPPEEDVDGSNYRTVQYEVK